MKTGIPTEAGVERLREIGDGWTKGALITPANRITEGLRIRGLIELRFVRGVDALNPQRIVGGWCARRTASGREALGLGLEAAS